MALVMEALVGTPDREFVSAGVSVEEAGVGEEGDADIPDAEVCTSGATSSKPMFSTSLVENICSLPST
jgi:hypothetical protein